jgi:hypothetical protein
VYPLHVTISSRCVYTKTLYEDRTADASRIDDIGRYKSKWIDIFRNEQFLKHLIFVEK